MANFPQIVFISLAATIVSNTYAAGAYQRRAGPSTPPPPPSVDPPNKIQLNEVLETVQQLRADYVALKNYVLPSELKEAIPQAILTGSRNSDGMAPMEFFNYGNETIYESPSCMNLRGGLIESEILVVNTFSSCVRLYDQEQCVGGNYFIVGTESLNTGEVKYKSIGIC